MSNLLGYNRSAGGNNSYTVGCTPLNRRCHYCICINFLRAVEENRIGESFADCQKALRSGDCIAFTMREEEKAKGEAIYYESRKAKIPKPEKRLARATQLTSPYKPRKKTISNPAPKADVEPDSLMLGGDMAKVITDAIDSEKNTQSYPKPKKGEPLIEFAHRFKKFKDCYERPHNESEE